MKERTAKLLYDILEAAKAISFFTRDMTFESFSTDDLTRSAVERKFEIIGEALRRIREEDTPLFDQIERGHQIVGMRNRLIHGYDAVDEEIVWETIATDIPKLEQCATTLLQNK